MTTIRNGVSMNRFSRLCEVVHKSCLAQRFGGFPTGLFWLQSSLVPLQLFRFALNPTSHPKRPGLDTFRRRAQSGFSLLCSVLPTTTHLEGHLRECGKCPHFKCIALCDSMAARLSLWPFILMRGRTDGHFNDDSAVKSATHSLFMDFFFVFLVLLPWIFSTFRPDNECSYMYLKQFWNAHFLCVSV